MSDSTAPERKRCGARTEHFRVTCDLLEDHVQTIHDWHEGNAVNHASQTTKTHTLETNSTETVRWAPNQFEVRRRDREPE